MLKVKKKILGVGLVILVIIICWLIISSKETIKTQKPKEVPSKKPMPVPPPPKPPRSFPIDNIPTQRKHDWGGNWELTAKEEKTVIESLASQFGIDKNKSYFDYRYGFGMIPAVREISEDQDQAFYLFTDKGKFFCKISNFSDLSRFEYEKESMLAINEAVPDLAPHPLVLGNLPEGGKFLVVNYLEARWHDRLIIENQKLLARSLAQLHQKKPPNGKFGFHSYKNNQWKDNWMNFFLENRWQPLWKRTLEEYSQDEELKKWGEIIGEKVIPDLLGNLPIEPVLIHGNLIFDAWDTNSQTKQPWVFDTYSYYGHNEMDLSLIHYYWPPGKIPKTLEGEFFEPEFLAEYQKYHSLPPGFEKRRDLYRLYDYLFRRIGFRGLTIKSHKKCLTMMRKLGEKYN